MASIRDQLRMSFRQEGVDHINLSPFANTEIGKYAALDYRKRFFIPHLGEFGSPRCFANWMSSGGDDSLRLSFGFYNSRHTPLNIYRMFMLYAKFYQILAIRSNYEKHKDKLALPWVVYKEHLTGIKEFDRWEAYSQAVKSMVTHVLNSTNAHKSQFDWNSIDPNLLCEVEAGIRQIAINNGADPDSVVKLTEADEVARKRKAEQKANRDTKAKPVLAPAEEQPAQEATAAEEAPAQEDTLAQASA